MPSVEDQIRTRIEQFVDELTGLVREAAMEAVGTALGNGAVAAPARRGRPLGRKKAASRKKRGRPRKQVDTAPVLAHIIANPDIGVSDIAAGMGTDSNSIKPAIAALLEAGEISKTGERRGTKYHPKGTGGGGRAKKKAGRRKTATRKAGARKRVASRKKAM